MDENYILKEGCITSPMLDEHSTATIVEKTVNVSDIGEFVVGEMNSSVITFKMNRYYDGVDLSQKDILIMYKNTNGVYKDKAVNIQYSTDGLKFSWIVPNDATKTIKITAYVCFISDDYLWKTKNFTISFNPSFDVTDTEHTTNWFVSTQIQDANKMYFIENRYDITYDKITSIINGNKILIFTMMIMCIFIMEEKMKHMNFILL